MVSLELVQKVLWGTDLGCKHVMGSEATNRNTEIEVLDTFGDFDFDVDF